MVVKVWNRGKVFYQTEEAIVIHDDNCGTVVLDQAGRSLCLNVESIPELCKVLTALRAEIKEDAK